MAKKEYGNPQDKAVTRYVVYAGKDHVRTFDERGRAEVFASACQCQAINRGIDIDADEHKITVAEEEGAA